MKRKILLWGATVCVLSLFCAAQARAGEEVTIRGKLASTVEANGWLIVTPKQSYLLLNAARWRKESWFKADAEVEATGVVKKDVVTTAMEGTPFEARALRPITGSDEQHAASTRVGFSLQPLAAPVQSTEANAGTSGLTRVTVSGEATVQAQPDTAMVSVGVTTQGRNALAAQQENARLSDAVVRAVRDGAGANAEVQTSGYSLQPQYAYNQGQAPTITGYEARNMVNVTLSDLSRVGAVIDAASNAGATNVNSISFTLRHDRTARAQALTEATRAALDKAQAVAQALGGRVARIVAVQEGGMLRPVPIYEAEAPMARAAVANAPPTPIQSGALDIHAEVALVAEISTGK
jgi:uncharacterized protein